MSSKSAYYYDFWRSRDTEDWSNDAENTALITEIHNIIIDISLRKKAICDPGPQTSHKGKFFEIEIYTSSESWINNISIDVWFVMIGQYLKIWNLRVQKNLNIEKITFKVVQMKFLAMHITNQKLSFDIFTVGHLQNIFMEHDLNILMIFGIKKNL